MWRCGLCAVIAAGCGEEARGTAINVEPFVGVPVSGTRIECDPALASVCPTPRATTHWDPGRGEQWSNVPVTVGANGVGGTLYIIHLFGTETATSARAEARRFSDETDELPPDPVVLGGSVAPDLYAIGGRNTGAFVIELEDGSITGTYDTGD